MKNKLVPVVASKMGNCVVKGQGHKTDVPLTRCPFVIFEFCTVYIYFFGEGNGTPVLLPGESHGRRSLVGCSLWGHTELDTTEET